MLLDVDLVKHHILLLGIYVGFHLHGNMAGKHREEEAFLPTRNERKRRKRQSWKRGKEKRGHDFNHSYHGLSISDSELSGEHFFLLLFSSSPTHQPLTWGVIASDNSGCTLTSPCYVWNTVELLRAVWKILVIFCQHWLAPVLCIVPLYKSLMRYQNCSLIYTGFCHIISRKRASLLILRKCR